MRYDKRVTLIRTEEKKVPTGYETITVEEKIIPCQEQPLSIEEQTAIYGAYMQKAVKIHVLKLPFSCDKVLFEEKEYDVTLIREFRKRAVLYLSEVV